MKLYSKKVILNIIVVLLISFLFTGCNAFKKQESSQPDYKEMKQMVIDILQTKDGQKIIQETVQDTQVKKKLILESDEVKGIIEKELLSSESKEKLKSLYEDPKFAKELAKILKEENKKLLTDLLKEPEYRSMMIEVMKEKEFEENILDIMKSSAYRNQMKIVLKESLDSPMFKYDILKLMEEASKKALEPEKKEKKKSEEGGNEESS